MLWPCDRTFRPGPSRSSSPTSRARRGSYRTSARSDTRLRSPSIAAWSVRRSGRMRASRSTRKVTRSSSPSRGRRTRSPPPPRSSIRSPRARSACASACTPGCLWRRARGTSATTCTSQLASRPQGTGASPRHGRNRVARRAARPRPSRSRRAPAARHRATRLDLPARRGSFPPLKTLSNTNLPRPASSFVGRERELEELRARVAAGARLLTLTGPGGSGKTRLAIEAAATLVPEYEAGVFWVGLAHLRDPALVSETIARALGAKNGLAEHIGARELLVLLDNLEQVVAAATDVAALLSTCPNLTVIVTSRELLRVQGEVEFAVPPLAAPEAITLFCERAQLEPSDVIGELCERLDSLPLAVELAAARARLSPEQILGRLPQRLDLLRGVETPIHARRRFVERSSGRTTCSRSTSNCSSAASRSSSAGARWRPPRRWPAPARHPPVPGREEPASLRGRALPDARDDSRVRGGATGRG